VRIGLRVVESPPPDESRLVNGDSHGVSELGQQLISESLSNPLLLCGFLSASCLFGLGSRRLLFGEAVT
jgi:hypothetical protein